jgi:MFS family permease
LTTTLFFSVFSLLSAFSWDVVSLGVCRVLTSAGLSAMTVVAVIYLSEMFPAAVRGKYQAYAIVIGICGTPVTNLLASAVVPFTDWSWRLVYVWGSLGLFGLVLIRRLTESPRWYESRGDHARADAALRTIEEQVAAERGPLPEPAAPTPSSDVHVARAPLRLLLQKRYLGATLLLTVLWVSQTIGFFGYSTWAPTLLAKEGFSVESSIFYVAGVQPRDSDDDAVRDAELVLSVNSAADVPSTRSGRHVRRCIPASSGPTSTPPLRPSRSRSWQRPEATWLSSTSPCWHPSPARACAPPCSPQAREPSGTRASFELGERASTSSTAHPEQRSLGSC